MLLSAVILFFGNRYNEYQDDGGEYQPLYLERPFEYFFKGNGADDLPQPVGYETFFDMVDYFPKCCQPNFSYDIKNRECLESTGKILNIYDELYLDVNAIKCGLRSCEVIVDKYVKKTDFMVHRDQDYTSLTVFYKGSELNGGYDLGYFCLDNIIDNEEEFVIRYCMNKEECFENDNVWCLPKCCQDGFGFIDNECRLSQKHGLRTKNSDQLFEVKDDFAFLSDMVKCPKGIWHDLHNLTFSIENNGSLFVTDDSAVRHYEVDEYCLETSSFTNSSLVKETVMLCDLGDANIVSKTTPLEKSVPEPPLISLLASTFKPTSIAEEPIAPEEKLVSGLTSKLTTEKGIIIDQTTLISKLTSIKKETSASNLLAESSTEDNTKNIMDNTSDSSTALETDKNWTSKQTNIQQLVSNVTTDQPLEFESPSLLNTPVNPPEESLASLESVKSVNDKFPPSPSDAMVDLSSKFESEENLYSISLFEGGSTQIQQVLFMTTSIPSDLEEESLTPMKKITEKSIAKESFPSQFEETSKETLKTIVEDILEQNLPSGTAADSTQVPNFTTEEVSTETEWISKQTSKETLEAQALTSHITTDANLGITFMMSLETVPQEIELVACTSPEIIRSMTEDETSMLTPDWSQTAKSKKRLTAITKSATSASLPASRSISEDVEVLTSEMISSSSTELMPQMTSESIKESSSFDEIESTSLLSTVSDISFVEVNPTFGSIEIVTERNKNKLKNTMLHRKLVDTHKLEDSTLETTVDETVRQVQTQEVKTSTDQSTVKSKFENIEEDISESTILLSKLISTSTLTTELTKVSDAVHDNSSSSKLDTTDVTTGSTLKEFKNTTLKNTDKLETLSEIISSSLVPKVYGTERITTIQNIKIFSDQLTVTAEYGNELETIESAKDSTTSPTSQMISDALPTVTQEYVTLKAQTEKLPVDSSPINAAVTTTKSSTEVGDVSTAYSVQTDPQTFSVTSIPKKKSTQMLTSVLSESMTASMKTTETKVPILKSTLEISTASAAESTTSEHFPSSSAIPSGQRPTEIYEKTYSSSVGFDKITPTSAINLIEFSSDATSPMTPTAVPPLSPSFLARASEKMIFVSVLCYIITIIVHILIYQLHKVSERLVGCLCFVDLLFSTAYTMRMYVDDFGILNNTFGYLYSFLLISRASWLNVLVYEINYVISNNRTDAYLTSHTKSMVFYTLYALLIPIAATVNLGLCAENIYELPESFRPQIDERGIIHGENNYGYLHLYGPVVLLNVLNLGIFMVILRNFSAIKINEYQKKNEIILKMLKVGLLILVTAIISFCEYMKGSRRNVNMQSVEEINIVAEGLIFVILFSIRPRRMYDTAKGNRDYVVNS